MALPTPKRSSASKLTSRSYDTFEKSLGLRAINIGKGSPKLLDIKLLRTLINEILSIFSGIVGIWGYSSHLFVYKEAASSVHLLTYESVESNESESTMASKTDISIPY
jgi:hypothetical protein